MPAQTVYVIQWRNILTFILLCSLILYFVFGGIYLSNLKATYENVCVTTLISSREINASNTIIPLATAVFCQLSWIICILVIMSSRCEPVGVLLTSYIFLSILPGHIFFYSFPEYDHCSMAAGGYIWLLYSTVVWMALAIGIGSFITGWILYLIITKLPKFFVKKIPRTTTTTADDIELAAVHEQSEQNTENFLPPYSPTDVDTVIKEPEPVYNAYEI